MSNKFWSEFISLYRENSCLWDVQSSSYMRRDLRNAAYNVLLDKYRQIDSDATMDMVKKKIDVFRTGYRRELRKLYGNSEISPDTEYKPSLWYFDLLSFLNFDKPKDTNESDDNHDDHIEDTTIEYIDIPTEYCAAEYSDPVVKYRLKKRKLEPKPCRPRKDAKETPVSFEDEDDCSTYCANLRLQMKELETEQKYIAQKLISDVIFLARTSQLTLDSSINT